jgi:glycosyltransferase involved in cell wall biosynthesis
VTVTARPRDPSEPFKTSDAVVAVITTCYNQEDLIERNLASVRDQATAAKVYHVIADDGSADASPLILRKWEAEHDHIRVVECTNRNVAGAFNAALLAVPPDAEYIVVIGGDDYLADNFVEECLWALGDADMVVPGMRREKYPGHNARLEMPRAQHPTAQQVWEWRTTYAWAVALFRRECLVETGGFHQVTEGDCDWDMWIDLVRRGYAFAYTDKTWFYYVHVPTSLNRTKTKEIWDEHRREMCRHHVGFRTLPGLEWEKA